LVKTHRQKILFPLIGPCLSGKTSGQDPSIAPKAVGEIPKALIPPLNLRSAIAPDSFISPLLWVQQVNTPDQRTIAKTIIKDDE
jgi:hypothetical protein